MGERKCPNFLADGISTHSLNSFFLSCVFSLPSITTLRGGEENGGGRRGVKRDAHCVQ
jgi:hypothetical protein